jgi:hypothetical protein
MPLYVLAGIILILLIWIIRLEWRITKLLAGEKGASLEKVIRNLIDNVEQTDKINEEIQQHLIGMEQRLKGSIQHVKTVRFNPFKEQGQGSNQSFAVALLNEHGDGVVLSSLYTRDKVSIYAKPIAKRGSDYEITEEEAAVLAQ